MKRTLHGIAGLLLAAAVLTGCGGGSHGDGGGGTVPPVAQNPPTQPQNPQNPQDPQNPPQVSAYDKFVAYLQAMVETMLDTDEPANVAGFDPAPTSETADPVATR
ncbi:MAG: hypothetical protein V4636_20340 [Pseudomonadota bacterium]